MGMLSSVFGSKQNINDVYFEPRLNQNIKKIGSLVNNKPDGEWFWYYENGQVWRQEDYKNGLLHGKQTTYHQNGNKNGERNYLNGKIEGKCYLYHSNGNIKNEVICKNDKRNGEHIEYYEDGKIKFKMNFINEEISGDFIWYHPNGNLREECNFKRNKKNGKIRQYYQSNEKLMVEFQVTDGEIDDQETIIYNNDGSVLSSSVYKNKKIISHGVGNFSEDYLDTILFGDELIEK
jgi:antitoxin component YwqK of YwqJK toxin-antitoxin module